MLLSRIKCVQPKAKAYYFLCLIFFGYIAGIASKLVNEEYMASFASKWYVLIFYILNITMVGIDLALYIRNYKIDQQNIFKNGFYK